MSPPVRMVPTWLKWTWRVGGTLAVAGSLGLLVVASVNLTKEFKASPKPLSTQAAMRLLGGRVGQLAGGLAVMLVGVWMLQRPGPRKPAPLTSDKVRGAGSPPAPVKPTQSSSPQRWQWCNVLAVGTDRRHLWQFASASAGPALKADERFPLGTPLPASAVTRDWRALWQPKLNIAWLPADQVFLRVVQLPKSDTDELAAMLELQLEKLSPIPLNQIVWSFELLPVAADDTQSVLLVIAERSGVETFLGTLEQERFVADRLEVPQLHQMMNHPPTEDGTWLYLSAGETQTFCLAAWWYGGRLQDLNLLQVPHNPAGPELLTAHLTKIAWGGEIEGWLKTAPVWNLVADEATAPTWETALRPWAGESLHLHAAPTPEGLATLSARRSIGSAARANLLPPDFATRYRQQFIDQLWMSSLGAAVVLYVVGVLGYFGYLQYLDYHRRSLQTEVVQMSTPYTNALRLKERVKIFQEQADLKSAALDCLRVTAELLPTDLTLTQLNFKGGKDLYLQGTVTSENQIKVTEFNSELGKASVNGEPLFDKQKVQPAKITSAGGTQSFRWDFTAGLNLADAP
jgi:hypothetical protein